MAWARNRSLAKLLLLPVLLVLVVELPLGFPSADSILSPAHVLLPRIGSSSAGLRGRQGRGLRGGSATRRNGARRNWARRKRSQRQSCRRLDLLGLWTGLERLRNWRHQAVWDQRRRRRDIGRERLWRGRDCARRRPRARGCFGLQRWQERRQSRVLRPVGSCCCSCIPRHVLVVCRRRRSRSSCGGLAVGREELIVRLCIARGGTLLPTRLHVHVWAEWRHCHSGAHRDHRRHRARVYQWRRKSCFGHLVALPKGLVATCNICSICRVLLHRAGPAWMFLAGCHGSLQGGDVRRRHGLGTKVLDQLLAKLFFVGTQGLKELLQALQANRAASAGAHGKLADYPCRRLEVAVLHTGGEQRRDHRLLRQLAVLLVHQLRKELRCEHQSRTTSLAAAAQQHGVDDTSRNASVLGVHVFHQSESFLDLPHLEMELYQDGEGNVGGLHSRLEHVLEDPHALVKLLGLGAAVDEAVVHDLVALQVPSLQLFPEGQSLVHLPDLAVALDEGTKGDQVGFNAHLHHVLQEVCSRLKITAAHAHIHERVESHEVAGHLLHSHLVVEVHGSLQVAHLREAFDQGRIQNCVLVHALHAHLLEDCHCFVQAVAFHTGV
mmetsp:Transcript_10449/g.25239  ORF Transcript_10449/g.25239 Transcript_10449/m.25239 type:complete len:607 (-) Transcript_10449:832-2652(-)